MKSNLYAYNTGCYFSTAARVLGWITTVWAILAVVGGSVSAFLILPAAIITQLTHYKVEFDLQHITYREGVSFAGLTFGKKLPLPGFDFLFLKKNNYKQTMESRASMATIKMVKYDGYIKLTNNVKLHLLKTKDQQKAMQVMEQIAQDLNVEFRDLTEMKYY
ncbi:hypothetical protein H8S95_09310 [Pontibacter sp. KCTC 32443]|uniref:hypothetical protein n=1 Tax=Pontibacter TaxID=323449 RepID=UPI00164E6FF9|nr:MULTISPECIES: hypothetical protein [Pontibacter]MBC5774257.1 hypothetical protein [Pontibacter sp. KCTC 32443]